MKPLLYSEPLIGLLTVQAARHQALRSGRHSVRSNIAYDLVTVVMDIASYDAGRSKRNKQNEPYVSSTEWIRKVNSVYR